MNKRQDKLLHDLKTLEEYKEMLEKLKAENTKLKTQYNYIPIPTFTFEKKKDEIRLIQYNNEACKLCDKEKDLTGQTLDELFVELVEINQNVRLCFKTKESFSEKAKWVVKEPNEVIYFSVSYVYIPENTVMFHMEDITEQELSKVKVKKAELESKEAIKKEHEFGKMKTNFISIVSHEFRTPLAGISSNTQLIQKYSSRWDKEKKSLVFKRIHNAIQYLNQMLEGVSLLGRDYSGQLEYNAAPIELEAFCLQIIDEIHISIGKAARINFTYMSAFSNIKTDKVLLRHVISNLLSNAVKYSSRNQTVDFDVVCTEDKTLKIKVKDLGIGIEEEDLKHIFEPFQRGSNVSTIQGTGLGLSIVKRCVDLLDGEVSVKSKILEGTSIQFEFKITV